MLFYPSHVLPRFVFSRFSKLSLLLLRAHHLKRQSHLPPLVNYSKHLKTLKQIAASLTVSSGSDHVPNSVSSKFTSLYTQSGDLNNAVSVFSSPQEHNTKAWNSIIRTHVDFGRVVEAFSLYRRMRELGVVHDGFTFPIINSAISLLGGDGGDVIECGKMIHCVAVKMGFGLDLYFCNTMMEVYGKCGLVSSARKVFDEMLERDLVSWTTMISGYVCEGSFGCAFRLFRIMRVDIEANFVTVIVLLQGCSLSEMLSEGRQIHSYVIKNGLLSDGVVQNSVLRLYARADSFEEEEIFFSEMDQRDTVSWNTIIGFYSSIMDIEEVVAGFRKMQSEALLTVETLTLVVSAFAKSGNLNEGKNLHCFAVKVGLFDNIFATSLLDFYAKLGDMESSDRLFGDISNRNAITCNAMMSSFVQNGYSRRAIALFRKLQDAGLQPGVDILRNLVDAYANLGALNLGKGVHAYLVKNLSYELQESNSNLELETSILNMYIRCGSISTAREFFSRILAKDVVTWTSMIEGYGTHGLGLEAIEVFHQMVHEGIKPNSITSLSLLSACSHSGLVSEGCEVFHSMKWEFNIRPALDHYTCLVDLLGRSGNLKEALAIIMRMVPYPDSGIWGALLAASREYGDKRVGEFAGERLLKLEADNVGYYTLLSNVKASRQEWAEVEELRRGMNSKYLKKKPGWSCVEQKGRIHGFVSGGKLWSAEETTPF